MPVNSAEVLQLFLQVNKLQRLLAPENGDERWVYLQKWLRDNPQYEKQPHLTIAPGIAARLSTTTACNAPAPAATPPTTTAICVNRQRMFRRTIRFQVRRVGISSMITIP